MYLGLMRFPCSVNELLRMRSCTDIPIHKETRIRIYGMIVSACLPRCLCASLARLLLNYLRRVNNSTATWEVTAGTLKLQPCQFTKLINSEDDKFSKRLKVTIFSWIIDVKDWQHRAKLNVTSR